MKTPKDRLARREFLKVAALGAAGVAVSASLASTAAPEEKKSDQADAIATRTLGKTGLKLPLLGYGGAAIVTMWGSTLSREDRVALVRYAFDRGIRYFDTAPGYPESQAIFGDALKDRRDQVCLVTKIDTTKPEDVRKSVEKSLKELQTDHLDILLIHGEPGLKNMTVEQAMKIHAEQVKLRDEGITRFLGFSAHGFFDKALALIDSGGFDQCMLSYGYLPRGYDQVYSAKMAALRDTCVAKAHKQGMGVVAMKVIGAGMLVPGGERWCRDSTNSASSNCRGRPFVMSCKTSALTS